MKSDKTLTKFSKILTEMKKLYLSDKRPWIVGFSGGKDSTCVVQLVFYMLMEIPPEKRNKTVHIISSNTLVESPLIDKRVENSLSKMEKAATELNLPIKVKRLRPMLGDTFWVNLIGRGYPSPNRWFRWCTDRLKIRPATRYILQQVKQNGEVIILLGARKSESSTRAHILRKYAISDFRLRMHTSIPGAFIYTPLEDLSSGEIWSYLLKVPSPWGDDHRDLRKLYGKTDAEPAFMIDATAPPTGRTRFGCWVCTVVNRDRAIEGLINNGEEWLKPLLEFRNWLKRIRDDPSTREDVRREEKKRRIVFEKLGREYKPQEHRGHKVLGPFTLDTRHEILRRLMQTQRMVEKRGLRLITPEEIKAIEILWAYDGDECSIASILRRSNSISSVNPIVERQRESEVYLSEICEQFKIPAHLIRRLLIAEEDFSGLSRKKDVYSRLEKIIEEHILTEGDIK